MTSPLVIAHRTCPRHAPENSLAGIGKAAELGADAVEIDVRLTRDRVPVLLHDRTLRRTTGRRGPTFRARFAELRTVDIGGGEPVPTFAEALAALPPGLMMAIDLKSSRAATAVLDEIGNQRAESRVWLWSRQPSLLRRLTARHPSIEMSLLRDTRTELGHRLFLRAAHRSGARGISARWEAITPHFVERAGALGLRVYAWCRTEDIPLEPLSLVDGVVTDWPDVARRRVAMLEAM